MTLTYYGHSCFDVSIGGKYLLFDPFITHNELARGIDIETIPADYILVSHGHEDHVADAESIAKRTGATLISNFEIVSWFGEKGITNGHPMNLFINLFIYLYIMKFKFVLDYICVINFLR